MLEPSLCKLGKLPTKFDPRTLKLANYIGDLPPAPPTCDWTKGRETWQVLLNDRIGNCTIVGCLDAIITWHQNLPNGDVIEVPDSIALNLYEQWDGYKIGDSSTDRGGVEIDVLNKFRKQGITINGVNHRIRGYADPDPRDLDHVRQSINLFGGVYIGIQLPISAQTQDVWDVAGGWRGRIGSWGGHCLFCNKYDEETITGITWGRQKRMTDNFFFHYVDEVHTILSDTDWSQPSGNFSEQQLLSDLAKVAA